MKGIAADESLRRTAKIAGLWYLLMAVCSAFGMMYVDSKLFVPGNAESTISNIQASEWLFRLGFVANLVGQIGFVFLASALYKLLMSVNKDRARLMVMLVVASIPVACLAILSRFVSIILVNGSGYLSVFPPAQLHALAMAILDAGNQGIFVAQVFWGLWLFPLGLLVFRSGFIPKTLGVLLVVGCFGYLVDCLMAFFFPGSRAVISPISTTAAAIAELAFIAWLLIKGIKTGSRGAQAPV